MKARFIIAMLGLVVLFPVLSHVVLAHHSNTYYSVETKVIKGTIVEFRWRNPHAIVVWDVKDDAGKVVRWAGELSSVTTLMGDGLRKDSLKPGDEITFVIRPSKVGSPQASIQSMKRPDGTFVLQWSTQSEVGLTQEQVAKARVTAGLPPTSPLRGGSNVSEVKDKEDR